MLLVDEREYLKGLLNTLVSAQAQPRQFLVSRLPTDLRGEVAEGLAPERMIDRVISLCERDAWRRKPTALSLMLAVLGPQGRVPEILARVATAPPGPTPEDPFFAAVLDNGLPFLDRRDTRIVLKTWPDVFATKQIHVVEGNARTGKSYTNEFVRHVVRSIANQVPDISSALVTLVGGQASSVGQVELASDLVGQIGGDPRKVPPDDTNTSRWTQELVKWVLAEANSSQLRWWFVLDGFRSSLPGESPAWQLREDTRDFIANFVSALTNGINVRRHRLMLLDFDRTILAVPPGGLGLDKTCSIPRNSISALIGSVIAASNKGYDPAEVEADIMEGFGDPIDDLPELNIRLVELMELA